MLSLEIVRMAWKSLGANRLRSALSASGITCASFSVVRWVTAISALQSSIESGLSFLGSNVFQFSKYPNGFETIGDEMYRNRRNIDYETYLNFVRLVGNDVELTCPKIFDEEVQAVFENKKT